MKVWMLVLTIIVVIETLLIGIFCFSDLKIDGNSAGVFISALGILVTFVVAWQIWQVIDTKNIVKNYEKSKKEYDNNLEKQTRAISEYIFASACLMDALGIMSDTYNAICNGITSARGKIGYNWAYKVLLKSLSDALNTKIPNIGRHINMCLDNMNACLRNAEKFKATYERYCIFDKDLNDACEDCYSNIINNHSKIITHEQHIKLKNLHDKRVNLS